MDMRSLKLAHDLKMPIQLIYSCVQLLEMEMSPNARAEGYLQMLMQSADQLQSMVCSALDGGALPEAEAGVKLRVQDVVAITRELSRQAALLAGEKGVRVHFETNVASFRMPTDGEKLRRMLNNLLSNALRFAPPGGHVAVAVRTRGDAVDFVVTDDGCGVPEEKRERIFELGETDGGHGYGLAIVREYAHDLGGGVSVAPAPGRGCAFTLHLPVPKLG